MAVTVTPTFKGPRQNSNTCLNEIAFGTASGGGGGGGDASAANQTSQITQETAINTVLGVKGDAKSTATDTTAISGISIWKQISASIQAAAASLAGTLTVAAHAVTQSGTWTVQPGNTANTTAWKVDGSAVTQPVSGTVTANAGSGTLAVSLASGATAIAKAEDVASADADVGVPAMVIRKATPANTSGTDGDYEMLQASGGRLWVQLGGDGTTVSSTAYEASRVLKASAGTLISVFGYNSKASAQFIQVHNTTSVPADTAVPIVVFTVAATGNFALDIPITGLTMATGISVCNSSTGPTKTVGSADCWFTASVK